MEWMLILMFTITPGSSVNERDVINPEAGHIFTTEAKCTEAGTKVMNSYKKLKKESKTFNLHKFSFRCEQYKGGSSPPRGAKLACLRTEPNM